MSVSELQISYLPAGDWSGEIVATIKSGAFRAEGAAFFNPDHVKDTFVPKLRSYPLNASALPILKDSNECRDFRIVISPYDARGTLLVSVDLRSPPADVPYSRATIHFFTGYAEINVFAEELEQLLFGPRETAVLRGN